MFNSSDAPSWEAETEIFMTDLLRHENILGFIAADKFDMGYSLQHWIITDYISNGSLMEYLSERTLSIPETLRLAKGVASGVSHLHTEIKGGHRFNSNTALYKPCVTHRDIKSRNILVSATGDAVLADFGLAVRYGHDTPQYLCDLFYRREGTKRYMSPELLQERVDENDVCEVSYTVCTIDDQYSQWAFGGNRVNFKFPRLLNHQNIFNSNNAFFFNNKFGILVLTSNVYLNNRKLYSAVYIIRHTSFHYNFEESWKLMIDFKQS